MMEKRLSVPAVWSFYSSITLILHLYLVSVFVSQLLLISFLTWSVFLSLSFPAAVLFIVFYLSNFVFDGEMQEPHSERQK